MAVPHTEARVLVRPAAFPTASRCSPGLRLRFTPHGLDGPVAGCHWEGRDVSVRNAAPLGEEQGGGVGETVGQGPVTPTTVDQPSVDQTEPELSFSASPTRLATPEPTPDVTGPPQPAVLHPHVTPVTSEPFPSVPLTEPLVDLDELSWDNGALDEEESPGAGQQLSFASIAAASTVLVEASPPPPPPCPVQPADETPRSRPAEAGAGRAGRA